ncbi:MAG: peptide-methionine (R)-S-oxide reductase MsrB [Nanoarchaeota archaeon]
MKKAESYWKKKLPSEMYHVLREKGTEMPGTGKLLYNKKSGMYVCGACGNLLFSSKEKFDSGTGWPSFYDVAEKGERKGGVKLEKDFSLGMSRTEVVCAKCGSHLGHVFEEKATEKCPTGKRYCINSLALNFEEKEK